MKKILLLSIMSTMVIAGCATTEPAKNSVSYADYKQERHDLELVSDKHIAAYSACVRSGLKQYQATETPLEGNGIRMMKRDQFVVEIYKAIDSTYVRADTSIKAVENVLQRCK